MKKNAIRHFFAFILIATSMLLSQNLFAQTQYDVAGGGSYCIGGTGVEITLGSSDVGVNYQLKKGNSNVGSPVAGTGSDISFGLQTAAGTYTVEATHVANQTTATMSGSAEVVVNPLPAINLTASSLCLGGKLTVSGVQLGSQMVWKQNGSVLQSANAGWGQNATTYALNQVGEPYGVFVTANGDMYVSDAANSVVLKFPAGFTPSTIGTVVAGNLTTGSGSDSDQLDYPIAIFVDNSGYLYVADHYNNRIQKFPPNSTEGTKAVTVAAYDLDGPFDVKVDGQGNIFVIDLYNTRILQFPSGSDENTVGTEVVTGLSYPQGVAVDNNGNVYVADDDFVKKYPDDVIVAGGNGTGDAANQLNYPAGLYVDNSGNLFVVDQGNNRVQMFPPNSSSSTDATTVAGLGGSGSDADQLDYPFFVSMDGTGNLYVSDYSNGRIQKYNYNSSYTPTSAGSYSVTVTNGNGCTASDTVVMESSPIIYNVTGGGNFCAGSTGLAIGLSNSEIGVNYQLLNGTTNVGNLVAGTGSSISFGSQTTAGVYTVLATTSQNGCANTMSGNTYISVSGSPSVSIITDSVCAGRTLTARDVNNSGLGKIIWSKDGNPIDSSIAYNDTAATTVATAIGPVGVAINNDTVYTIGWFNSNVTKWAPGASSGTVAGGNNSLNFSSGLALDVNGNVYVADYFNNKVTKWSPSSSSGVVVAGGNGTGTAASQLSSPAGLYVDPAGTVYVADRENDRIQKWVSGATTGITVAGGNGRGNAANQLASPSGVFVDAGGNIFIADSSNHRIQKWSPNATSGVTVAGGNGRGAAANQLNNPTGVAVDGEGYVYVADLGNNRIQKWAPGATTGVTIAGGNGAGTSATQLSGPIAISLNKGNIYVADLNNSRIQKFAAHIDTVLNTGQGGGTYSVYVESIGGCSDESDDVIVPVMPWASLATSPALCYNTPTGSINLTVIGGVAPFTYNWSNAATTEDISNIAAGSYSVTVTDDNGCTATASATVSQPTAIAATSTVINVSCFGGSNGSIALTVSGGTAPYTYIWSNNATTKDISGLIAGTYSVTITDANGCNKVISATVSQALALATSANVSNVTCFGGNNGAIDLVVSNGTAPYTYSWSNGMSTEDISNLIAGSYNVTVTDSKGCNSAASYTVTQSPNALSYSLNITNTSCANPTSGAVSVSNVTGGTGPYTYSINNSVPSTTSTFTSLSSGVYKITVRDNANCAVSKDAGVIKPFCSVAKNDSFTTCINTPINISLSQLIGNDSIVSGDVVSIGDWVDPATGTLAYNNATKTFTYTPVTGYTGPITFTYTIKKDDSTFFWGGTNHFYEFKSMPINWFNSKDSASKYVKNGMKGYLATVTSAAENNFIKTRLQGDGWMGASDRANEGVWRWVTGPEGLENGGLGRHFSGQSKISTCIANTGAPVNGYYHNWNLGEPNDCTVPVPSPYSPTDINRVGEHASYFISSTGGQWNDFPPAVQLLGFVVEYGGLEDASLPVIGSTATVVINIDAPTVFNVTGGGEYCVGNPGVTINLNGSETGVNYQLKNGLVNVGTPVAGTGSAISFGTQLLAGTYSVVATKASTGCSITMNGSASVVVNPLPTVFNVTGGGTICPNTSAPIGLSNSQTGVSYQVKLAGVNIGSPVLGTGSALSFVGTLLSVPGVYTVVATNVTTGCTAAMNGSALVNLSLAPTAYTVTGGGEYCSGGNGVTVGLSNSDLLVSYQLKRGALNVGSPVSGLGGAINFGLQTVAGTYTVVATNLIGCASTMTGDATVNVVARPAAYNVIGGGSYCAGGNGVSIGLASSQVGVSYQLKNLSVNVGAPVLGTGMPISFGAHTSMGNYSVVATNITYGCTSTMTGVALVMVNPLPVISTTTNNVTCNGNNNGAVDLTVNIGSAPFTYAWSNAATTQDISNLVAGTYSVTVTDANGCSASTSAVVTQPAVLNVTGTSTITTINNGAINITVTGGTTPYSYNWSNNAVTEDVSGLAPGTYTVIVTDANGCKDTASFILVNPLSISGVITNVSCFNGNNGAIDVTVNGGFAPYTYLWNNNVTTQDITGLAAGNYTLLITDANNDTISGSWTITQPAAALTVAGVVSQPTCANTSNGAINITANGGTAPYTYQWNGNVTTEDRTNLSAGAYSVVVTDAKGCTATSNYTLTPADTSAPVIAGPVSGSSVTQNPLAPALNFHVFVKNNATFVNNQTEGSVAVGGNVTIAGNYTVSANSAGNFMVSGKTVSFVIGGQVIYQSGNGINVNQNGYVKIGNCTGSNVWYTDPNNAYSPIRITPGTNYNASPRINMSANAQQLGVSASNNPVCQANVVDFNTAFTQMQASATNMSALTANASLTNANGNPIPHTNLPTQVKINLNAGTNVLNINASDLNAVQNFTFNNQPSANNILVINVNAPGTFNWNVWNTGGIGTNVCPYIIYNFYNTTILNVQGNGSVMGTLFAPSANITKSANQSNIAGQVVGQSFYHSGGSNVLAHFAPSITTGSTSVIANNSNNTRYAGQATCSYAVNGAEFNPTATDNCGTAILSYAMSGATTGTGNSLAGVLLNKGITNIVWTATDGANTSTYNFSVTVLDSVKPKVVTKNITVTLNQSGTATITAAQVDSASSDNCGITSLTLNQTNFTTANIGNNTVTLTAVDASGNTATGTAIVTINAPITPLVVSGTVSNVTINGASNGGVNITVSGAVAPYTYSWSNGATTEDLTNVPAGTYIVTVTAANSAVKKDTFIVTQPSAVSIAKTITNVGINGQNTGAVNITVTGGVGPYTYSWSNGATTEDLTNVAAGTYIVTVTDANGAVKKDTSVVTQPGALSIAKTMTNVGINGQSTGAVNITVTGGVGPYTYSWSNGATTEDLTNVPAGTYIVTVTDANGAVKKDTSVVTQPAALSITKTITNVNINGQSTGAVNITVAGGVGPYTYSWSNGATTEDLTNVAAGTYIVTVTDANGAVKKDTSVITQPAALAVTGVVTNVTTIGGNNGAVNITVTGGVGPYTYSWSNGATTEDINGVVAGTYTVNVTDSKGAVKAASFTVTQPTAPLNVTISVSPVHTVTGQAPYTIYLGYGAQNVTLTAAATGGKPGYTYSWSPTTGLGSPNSAVTTAAPTTTTTYTVLVTDANGATKTVTQTINVIDVRASGNKVKLCHIPPGNTSNPQSLNAAASAVPAHLAHGDYLGDCLDASANVSNITCNGGNDGSVNLTIDGGATPYTYSWSNGATTEDINGVIAGTYTVTITDATARVITRSYTVTQPAGMNITDSKTNVKCFGGSDGAISLNVSNGNSPYSYLWSDNSTSKNRSGLGAGTYVVTVTDDDGCVKKDTMVITAPTSAITITGTVTNVKCKGSETGKIDITVTGGTGFYSYEWDDNSSNSNSWGNWCGGHSNNNNNNATTQDIDELEAGTYKVTVKDANGCTKIATFTVAEPSASLAVTGSVTNKSCGNTCNGAINITATGGTAPYTYKWNNNSTVEDRTGLCTGTYSVVVTDANGCTKSASFTVSQATSNMNVGITVNPNPTVSGQAPNTIFLGYGPQSVTLNASASNGVGSYAYSWYPTTGLSNANSASPVASPTSTRTYTVTVTDGNGCTKSSSVTINAVDVTDGSKILVCRNGDTKKISSSQVSYYLCNGYKLGECDDNDNGCGNKGVTEEVVVVKEMKLYPNPSSGFFNVELPENVKGGEAVVMDMNGKVIERKHFLPDTKLTFDLSYAPKGTYMIQIANGFEVYKARVVIN